VSDQVQDSAPVRIDDFLRQIEPEVRLDRVREFVAQRDPFALRSHRFVEVYRRLVGVVHPEVLDTAVVVREVDVTVRHALDRVPRA
jgi:hypothetical protein